MPRPDFYLNPSMIPSAGMIVAGVVAAAEANRGDVGVISDSGRFQVDIFHQMRDFSKPIRIDIEFLTTDFPSTPPIRQ